MPILANAEVDLIQVAHEFFEYIVHLTDIQEPDCYVADMTEKELREKVSDEKTKYGLYNKDYIHTEDSSENFVSIGEMHDDGNETPEKNHDIVIDNSWNVINNNVLSNSLQHDPTLSTKIEAIASINGQTSPTKVPYRSIIIAKESIQEKKFFSFTEANDAKIDTSKFDMNVSVPMELRYDAFYINLADQGS